MKTKNLFLSLLLLLLPVVATAQQKIAVVNSQELLTAMPDMKVAQDRLQELDKKYTAEMQTMNDEYQKKLELYMKDKEGLSEALLKSREQELADLQSRIQRSYQAMQQDMEKQQGTLMAPIQQKIVEAIKKVGDAGGYTYVMESTMMLYSGPSAVDITAQVKKQLGL